MKRSFLVAPLAGVLLVALATVGYAGARGDGDGSVGSDPGSGIVTGPPADPPKDGPSLPPGAEPPAPEPPRSTLVRPRPGMAGVHPVRWERAEPLDAWTVRIHFYSGVEPCSVLDSVKVSYTGFEVRIALFEGYDPAAGDVACIDLALLKAVDVRLDQPVAGRKVVDAAPR